MAARVLIAGGGTGGHLVPALNLAAALRRADPACELLMVGAERGVEARILPTTEYSYRLLPSEPLHRHRPWRNWRLLASAPSVAAGLAKTFRDFRPDLVVGTGGYASAPALAYAVAGRRRTAIQEQNAYPGLATRLLAPHVDALHLGYPEAAEHLRPSKRAKIRFHGNPVAPAGEAAPTSDFAWPDGPTIVVTGGSQGAVGLNRMLLSDLAAASRWPAGATMVWISGHRHVEAVSASVRGTAWADRIRVVPWVDALGARLMRGGAALAISRAGAMTCAELAAAAVPACLVPLPGSAADHQVRNARALEASGAARVFPQDATSPGALWTAVLEILESPDVRAKMSRAMGSRGRPDAADRIAADLLGMIGGGGSRADG